VLPARGRAQLSAQVITLCADYPAPSPALSC
jgi:hypothetical protein